EGGRGRRRVGDALWEGDNPIEEFNHVAVVGNHRSRIVTGAEQATGFVLEISVGEQASNRKPPRLQERAGKPVFAGWRKNDSLTQCLPTVERLRGNNEPAVSVVE